LSAFAAENRIASRYSNPTILCFTVPLPERQDLSDIAFAKSAGRNPTHRIEWKKRSWQNDRGGGDL
jgi:hypothetical protein